jgi:hypothetical protein
MGRLVFAFRSFTPCMGKCLSDNLRSTLQSCGITVDKVGDYLYRWDVRLHDFPSDSQLAKDLSVLQLNFGYNYVQLELVCGVVICITDNLHKCLCITGFYLRVPIPGTVRTRCPPAHSRQFCADTG